MTKAEVIRTFGQRMAEARMMRGMSILDLEKKTGIHKSSLSEYELDHHEPRIFYAVCIADALEVRLDWLTGRCEEDWLD